MKIALTSDIHLEFGDWNPSNPESADILILSGDIMVAADFGRPDPYKLMSTDKEERYTNFLEKCRDNYKHVIYVMGNHEHYHGDFQTTKSILGKVCSRWDNIHLLDKQKVKIDDVTFLGGTLWTDMNNEDPITLWDLSNMMNDFRIVKNSARKVGLSDNPSRFLTSDALEDHKEMIKFLKEEIESNLTEKYVVVGHHSPSRQSTHPRYKDETIMNGGYSSDLTDFILDHPQIKVWTHGHTHHEYDYMIASTRILCNPRGYVLYERGSDEEEPYLAKVFEV